MRSYSYRLLDVFTNRPFGGNPLAVFTDARGLTTEEMQHIARELNLSETTFVLPARDPNYDHWVRIFTPLAEMRTGGHPTLGTAFALALEARLRQQQAQRRVVFEEGVGPVSVTMEAPMLMMQQPLPDYGPLFDQRDAMAALLGLDKQSLPQNLPIQAISCGVPYLLVPLKDLESMRAIRVRHDIWDRMLARSGYPHIFAFGLETENATSSVHGRMFAPALGVHEDAATGSAGGPVGAYLVRYGLLPDASRSTFIMEQGIEIGRPSFIHITVERTGDRVTNIRVGGQCVAVGRGDIVLDGDAGSPGSALRPK